MSIVSRIKTIVQRLPVVKSTLHHRKIAKVKVEYSNLLNCNTPVFVFQMGKVASSSVYGSIKMQYNGLVMHAHTFKADHADKRIKQLHESYQNQKFKMKIISLVREPLGRNLSAFFQNFKRDVGVSHNKSDYTAIELREIFLKNYRHDIPLNWFDNNLLECFNIDVYTCPFPECGYLRVSVDNIDLLLLRHDLDDKIKEEEISSFIGIKDFKLVNENESTNKGYNSTYKDVVELGLPDWYIEKMLNSKYSTHFFQNDLEKLRKKWLETGVKK